MASTPAAGRQAGIGPDGWTALVWVVWACMRAQMRIQRGGPFMIVIGVVQPAVLLLLVTQAGSQSSPATTTSAATAVALTALWAAIIWAAGGILRRELDEGTLAANLTAVQPAYLVLFGKCLGMTARTVAIIVGTSAATLVIAGQRAQVQHPIVLLVGLLAVIASGTALGMLLSCLFLLTRYGRQLSSALMYPIFILGGMLIPVRFVPAWLRPVSWAISMRWAQEYLVGAVAGTARLDRLAVMIALTAVYVAISLRLFTVVVDRARRKGNLELL